MMKQALFILVWVILLAGCTGKKAQRQDSDLARQVFVAQTNPVEIMVLKKRDFHKQIVSNGKLGARRKAALEFQTPGWLAAIHVSNGSQVRQGEVLAALDTRDAKLQLESARLAFSKARLDLADRLLDFGYGPETDTASIPRETMRIVYLRSGYTEARHALESAELAFQRSSLVAPFAGKVADIKLKTHEQVSGPFCTLIDDAVFNVLFSVLETEAPLIGVGQPVKVHSFNDPEHVVAGRITQINPTVDANGQIQVTAQIPGNGRMMDGMNVRIFAEKVVPGQLVVPKSAVVIRDNLEVLFRYAGGKSVWTYVHVTASNSTEHVVVANSDRGAELSVGDTIIVSGNLNLGDNTSVEIEK